MPPLLRLICFGFLLLFQTGASRAEEGDRLNVLLILSDDHNYRALGCSGNEVIRTPNLDRLA
ncbi:MAG: arylsulfatase, partial [Verrucomicrobiae bacterium]|nr:arylsulfatase [Verrucomicrobiae bacterium]